MSSGDGRAVSKARADAERPGRVDEGSSALRGSLEIFSPWEILQWVSYRADECTLLLTRPGAAGRERAWLHLREGSLLGIVLDRGGERSDSKRDALEPLPGHLGAWLVDRGSLPLGRLRFALGLRAVLARRGETRPLGRLLVECGFLKAENLDAALAEFARECLAEVLGWRSGRFRLRFEEPGRLLLPVGERIEPLLLQLSHAIDDCTAMPPNSPL